MDQGSAWQDNDVIRPAMVEEGVDEDDSSLMVLSPKAHHPKLVQRHGAEDKGYHKSKGRVGQGMNGEQESPD